MAWFGIIRHAGFSIELTVEVRCCSVIVALL
jgi:hypothetical protein